MNGAPSSPSHGSIGPLPPLSPTTTPPSLPHSSPKPLPAISRTIPKAHLPPLPPAVAETIRRANSPDAQLHAADKNHALRYGSSANTRRISATQQDGQQKSQYANESHSGRFYELQTRHPNMKVGKLRRISASGDQATSSSRSNAPPSYQVKPSFGAISDEGFNASYNQDVLCTINNINEIPDTALFGMFDGHGRGGEEVAQLTRDVIVEQIKLNLGSEPGSMSDKALHEIFHDAFLKAQQATEEAGNQYLLSGATASLALLIGSRLTVAHVGDSRVVIGRECHQCFSKASLSHTSPNVPEQGLPSAHNIAVSVTRDHRVGEVAEERERIEAHDGIVMQDPRLEPGEYDDLRIYAKDQIYPGLVTSRTIGDIMAHSIGVISVPDVTSKELDRYDKVMILATDGVWDIVSNQEAVDIVCKYNDPTEATNALVETCVKGWSDKFDTGDNVSAIVVFLSPSSDGPVIQESCKKIWGWENIRQREDLAYNAPGSTHESNDRSKSPNQFAEQSNLKQDNQADDQAFSKSADPSTQNVVALPSRRRFFSSKFCTLL